MSWWTRLRVQLGWLLLPRWAVDCFARVAWDARQRYVVEMNVLLAEAGGDVEAEAYVRNSFVWANLMAMVAMCDLVLTLCGDDVEDLT